MIYIACGSIIITVGLLWLVYPAEHPNHFYGYFSYLAQVNKHSFHFAQVRASLNFIFFGLIQLSLGVGIRLLNWDKYFFLWLLTFYLFLIFPIMATEKSLKKFLLDRHELPADYIDPDDVRQGRTKGFKNRK
ncbi:MULTISPECIES: SdpI family protein [unclassified Lactobacillus]|uniref:SdpI family protein n=1 Tax=unclassified Lactobacillus TaxID=2620435 RepID=UPI000EFC7CE3|nr:MULTISPECIES: SdpI family protein [unclassified Lactobacillus]RMC25033.1 SdpI family protein [Lactobacillus sp. ESL0247]RMC29188.1 SdpI family protein [Lactobacillus sp. ESL0246]RMC32791.1 SdpI family protein [Lactobacillus sp. ESL0245]